MRIARSSSSVTVTVALILAAGAIIFGGVLAVRVTAATGSAPATAPGASKITSNNTVGSFGLGNVDRPPGTYTAATSSSGYQPLTITPTDETPSFITERLDEGQGMVLLVYCDGASDDMEMLSYFNAIKSQYAADSSFFSFESVETTELGDTLDQLRISNPPVLAIIGGDGEVDELYAGWIGMKVMEQRVADAVRGL